MVGRTTTFTEPANGFALTVVDVDPLRAAICAAGEFDLAARTDLERALRQEEGARRRIVRLDLSRVTFLDCSCLGVLVASHHRFLELRGLLVLTGVGEAIARILKITGVDDTLFIVPADQDPFGSLLMARVTCIPGVPTQRPEVAASFDALMDVADQLASDSGQKPRRVAS